MRTFVVVVLASLAVVPLAGSAPTAGPRPVSFAWEGPQIAVSAKTGLYLVDPRSGSRRLLTRKADPLSFFSWAPDGRTLVFGGRNFTLYTIRSDGSGLHKLGRGLFPRWSPDGRRIAYFRDTVGLYVMNANGTGAHLIARDRYTELIGPPAWSPDGKRLAYVVCTAAYLTPPCEHQYGFDVYTIPVAGGKRHRVSRKSGLPGCVEWSSRGRLSYTSGDGFVVLARGNRVKQLRLRGCAVWSPDGKRFATGSGDHGPIVAGANGAGQRQIRVLKTRTNTIAAVDWAPDSRTLAYLPDSGGGNNARLFRVGLDGRIKRLLP